MDVNIGYMCDPDDLPGLAHLCERMLHLGAKEFSDRNDYNMYLYLWWNGGSSSSSTGLDHTTFYFDIKPDKLEGGFSLYTVFLYGKFN
ncbi:putative zinc protease C28F5.4 [Temnothorax americanus]|uniref:putative zinc protease C28F5.4 n=1 Tax=Temnothorax americanus TaxID=1964332 RepID=UPI0040687389